MRHREGSVGELGRLGPPVPMLFGETRIVLGPGLLGDYELIMKAYMSQWVAGLLSSLFTYLLTLNRGLTIFPP